MRDNFNVHEWNIQQIRESNGLEGFEAFKKTLEFLRSKIYPKLSDGEMDKFVVEMCKHLDCEPPAYRLNEGWNDDIEEVDITYTNYGTLYKVKVDGKRVDPSVIEDLVGMELPTQSNYFDKEVTAVVDALKRKGIQADVYEMDVD